MPSDEYRLLRRRQDDLRDATSEPPAFAEGTPSMLVRVYSGVSMPTSLPGYFLTRPVRPGGTETEGGAIVAPDGTTTVTVLVVGTRVPTSGDLLTARLCDGRWVAESRGVPPPPTHFLSGCPCASIPRTLYMHVDHPDADGRVQACTFRYYDPAAGIAPGATLIGTAAWLGTTIFHDSLSTRDQRYWFRCDGGIYKLHYLQKSPFTGLWGGPFGTGVGWAIGVSGNTCTPFSLQASGNVDGGTLGATVGARVDTTGPP
jgi:hypothetical protein